MSNKLIDLNALSDYKTQSDLKYQDKLTAGAGINITNNVISATSGGGQAIYNVTIAASGWSGTSNAVTLQGVNAGDDIEILGINVTGMTGSQIQNARTALELITYGTTSANTVTFYALGNVPNVDIPVTMRRVVDSTVTTREYSAGSGISISGGVISATPVFGNTTISRPSVATSVAANSTNTVFTATRDCKISFEVQCQGTSTSAADLFVLLNGTRVYAQYQPVTTKYMRIIHGFLMLKSGDTISVQNPYSFTLEFPYTLMYD